MIGNNRFIVRELDAVAVKGKNQGIRIYELVDFYRPELQTPVYASYEAALKLYRDGKYLEAGKIWEQYIDIDPPSRTMALRCLAILRNEVTLTNGIYHLEFK